MIKLEKVGNCTISNPTSFLVKCLDGSFHSFLEDYKEKYAKDEDYKTAPHVLQNKFGEQLRNFNKDFPYFLIHGDFNVAKESPIKFIKNLERGKQFIKSTYDIGNSYSSERDKPLLTHYSLNKIFELFKILRYNKNLGLNFSVFYTDEEITYFKLNEELDFLVPTKYLDIKLFKDYLDINMSVIKSLNLGKNLQGKDLTVSNDFSISTWKNEFEKEVTQGMTSLETKIEEAQNNLEPQLAKLQAELEAKERELRETKESMMQEYYAEMEKFGRKKIAMEKKLFTLTTEIYGLRLFQGEEMQFVKIASGNKVRKEQPVTIFQKIKYLDEELGRFGSLYGFGVHDNIDDDLELFEQFLVSTPERLELFCPNSKCVSLIQVSKHSQVVGAHPKFDNVLKNYDTLHGKKLAVLIRNGENVWVGWTEESMFRLSSEDLFYNFEEVSRNNTKSKYYTDFEGKEHFDERDQIDLEMGKPRKDESRFSFEGKLKKGFSAIEFDPNLNIVGTAPSEMATRFFFYQMLQGILSNTDFLELPEKVDVREHFITPSKYLIFSTADTWIEDNRFGEFKDIIEKCNVQHRVGDTILSIQRITDKTGEWNRWGRIRDDERSRKNANRTHNVNLEDNSLYKINVVDTHEILTKAVLNRRTGCYVTIESRGEKLREPEIYVSLEKSPSWRGDTLPARANFRIYSHEFLNLTFLNSVWVTYAITNKKTKDWQIGGATVDYAYTIKYLNRILNYLKQREILELNELTNIDLNFFKLKKEGEEWEILLSEWKLEKNVHELTRYQAKRFINWLRNRGDNNEN